VKVTVPTFSAKAELVRYVPEINRLKGKRPAVATFLDPPSANPGNDHLSVNSLEVETMGEITAYFRWLWQGGTGRVGVCVHKVYEYTDAGKKCEIAILYNRHSSNWSFGAKLEDAFKHRPVSRPDYPPGLRSHSGVEFVRALKEHKAAQFARRLAGKRFHLI
jgi:hypothetical protein